MRTYAGAAVARAGYLQIDAAFQTDIALHNAQTYRSCAAGFNVQRSLNKGDNAVSFIEAHADGLFACGSYLHIALYKLES